MAILGICVTEMFIIVLLITCCNVHLFKNFSKGVQNTEFPGRWGATEVSPKSPTVQGFVVLMSRLQGELMGEGCVPSTQSVF